MKNFYMLLLLITVCSGIIYGQTKKGDVMLSSNFGISNSSISEANSQNEKSNYSFIDQRFGFFTNENFIIGIGFGRSRYEERTTNVSDQISSQNFEERLQNYYFTLNLLSSITDKLKMNYQMDVRIGRGELELNQNSIFGQRTDKGNVINNELLFRFGLMFFLSKRWLLTIDYGAFGFGINKIEGRNGSPDLNNEEFIASLNPNSLRLGLSFLLGKKLKSD